MIVNMYALEMLEFCPFSAQIWPYTVSWSHYEVMRGGARRRTLVRRALMIRLLPTWNAIRACTENSESVILHI